MGELSCFKAYDIRGQLGTETMATFTYRQMIDFRKIGFGSAASVTIFVIIALFVIIYLLAARSATEAVD